MTKHELMDARKTLATGRTRFVYLDHELWRTRISKRHPDHHSYIIVAWDKIDDRLVHLVLSEPIHRSYA